MRYTAKPGDVSLFENEKAGHQNAPDHRGYFVSVRRIDFMPAYGFEPRFEPVL